MEHPGFFERAAPIRLDALAQKVGAQLGPGADPASSIRDVKGLADAGFTRVSNLDGGLFRWVNEGHPVVNDQGSTSKVAPINWKWGRLLKARHRP